MVIRLWRLNPLRPTIGAFLHDIDESIGYKRYQGMLDQAAELDVNLFCIIQGTRTEPESRNIFNRLIVPKIDGMIMALSGRTSYMTTAEMHAYFSQFQLPIVTLTEKWPQTACVSFDSYQGMRDSIRHLADDHHYSRIYFIRGPQTHRGAQERYQAYLDVMMHRGLFDPALVSPPVDWKPNRNYSFEQLIAGLRPGIDFQAIAASNDDWAVEAMTQLEKRGIKVPREVAVVGFNDSVEAKNSKPPLTTVATPFYAEGRTAVKTLVGILRGESTGNVDVAIPSFLTLRESCGCLDPYTSRNPAVEPDLGTGKRLTKEDLIAVLEHSLENEGLGICIPLSRRLVETFVAEISDPLLTRFLSLLKLELLQTSLSGEKILALQNVLTTFRTAFIASVYENERANGETLLHQARALIGSCAFWLNENYQTQSRKQMMSAFALQTYLIRSFDLKEIVDLLARHLPGLGYKSCYFVLYDDNHFRASSTDLPECSRLHLAYNQQGIVKVNNEANQFPAAEVFPAGLLPEEKAFGYLIAPMFYEEYQFGYMILETETQFSLSFKIVTPQLKACLRGVHLFKERKKVEESLIQQTLELARSNAELQQFANIASHDLQEPLRKVLTFSERLRKNYIQQIPEEGRVYLERIEHASGRMRALINDLLIFSRVTSKQQPFEKVDLNQVAREVLCDIEIKIADSEGAVEVGGLPVIEADALQMRQLFQNLISNGLKFHRPGVPPRVSIKARLVGETYAEIVFADNGIGIETAYFERIFRVFERLHTRNEYEGTGVGLAICKKIAERHNGSIQVESEPGKGTQFLVHLPLQQNQSDGDVKKERF